MKSVKADMRMFIFEKRGEKNDGGNIGFRNNGNRRINSGKQGERPLQGLPKIPAKAELVY